MRSTTRLNLDAAHRVYALSKEHASTIKGYVDAVKQLGDRLNRAESLLQQQEEGEASVAASVATKDDLRGTIQDGHVAHIVRIARASLPADPELLNRFRAIPQKASWQRFVAAVRAILAEAASRKELFITEGMPETFVEDLEKLLDQYVQAIDQKTLATARRVGAVADLKAVTKEVVRLVRRLDGINQKRWQESPEMLAAWLSAKDVGYPRKPSAAAVAKARAGGGTPKEGGQEQAS
jgi:hypothetical protein